MADAKQETGANSDLEALRGAMRLAMSDASLQTLLVYLSKELPRWYYLVGYATLPYDLRDELRIDREDERFLLVGAPAPAYLRPRVSAWIAKELSKLESQIAKKKELAFYEGRIAALVPLAFGSTEDAIEFFANMGDINVVRAARGDVSDYARGVDLDALRKTCAGLETTAKERGKRVDWVDPETGGVAPTEDATKALRASCYRLLISNAQAYAREKEKR